MREKKKMIWVIIKHPKDKRGHAEQIPNELDMFQAIVGGSIETLTVAEDMVIICNANGLEEGLPYNCEVAGATFLGTIIVAGVRGEDFANVPITIPAWERNWLTGKGES